MIDVMKITSENNCNIKRMIVKTCDQNIFFSYTYHLKTIVMHPLSWRLTIHQRHLAQREL